MLATLVYAVVRSASRSCPPDRSSAVRWIPSPYRASRPVGLVAPTEDSRTIVRLAAWASFAQCFVVAPCLAFALARLHLAAFIPLVIVWFTLAVSHGWCGHALLRNPARAVADVRNLAHASLALAVPLILVSTMHFIWASPAEYDPYTPSLRIRLVFVIFDDPSFTGADGRHATIASVTRAPCREALPLNEAA
jgi:hypothetical protein